ncbi:MAG TPA: hypothetical protein VKV39_09560 [Candidatus Sulfotelmatobacter sp.]|nr:hypothetical protein [Candidatus Sulfotelmatobacter sp.]
MSRTAWLLAALALVFMLLMLPRSPLPWLDEILLSSTCSSILRGGPTVPTVMGAFPHTSRMDLFYGPVGFFLGCWDMELLGLSLAGWRVIGFLGAVGAVFSSAWVSRRLDRSWVAAACSAMFVALSQGMGARATCGRLDTVTVTLEMLSLASALCAMRAQVSRWTATVYGAAAGILCGTAALSTPRAFPFVLGLGLAVALEMVLKRSEESIFRGLIIGAFALFPVWLWTYRQGLSPLSWLRYILATSKGDKLSSSPMLHGSWHLLDEPLIPLLSGFLVILLTILVLGWTVCRSRERDDDFGEVRFASIVVVTNYAATFLTIARFWDYEIFVVPLVLPVLVAATVKMMRGSGSRSFQFLMTGSWLVVLVFLLGVRTGKIVGWMASYSERDPRPLQTFVTEKVPRNSYVFGPEDNYFYAVESAGSHYRFVRPTLTAGLVSPLDQLPDWQDLVKTGETVYLIWPTGSTLPHGLGGATLRLEQSISFKPKKQSWWSRFGWASGYPATSLYRVLEPESSGNERSQ